MPWVISIGSKHAVTAIDLDLRDIIHRVEMADLLQRIPQGFDDIFHALQQNRLGKGAILGTPPFVHMAAQREFLILEIFADFAAHCHYRTGPARL